MSDEIDKLIEWLEIQIKAGNQLDNDFAKGQVYAYRCVQIKLIGEKQ